jgi:hypothetical protein
MTDEVRAAIDEVRAWALAQFGWTHVELEVDAQGSDVALRGTVAALRLVDRIRAACPTIAIDASGVDVLRSGVFREVGACSLYRRPDREDQLATQLDLGDGPVELLARERGASLVRACDGTVGWTRTPLGNVVPRPTFAVPDALDEAAIARAFGAWVDVPYVLGGTRMSGVDCSGLVQRLLAGAGLRMPRHSTDQIAIDPQPGVALAIGTVIAIWSDDEAPCHVGLAVGEGRVVHASRSRAKVVLEEATHFVGRARKVEHVGVDALLRLQARAKDEPDLLAALR